jgi:hypothetical protein
LELPQFSFNSQFAGILCFFSFFWIYLLTNLKKKLYGGLQRLEKGGIVNLPIFLLQNGTENLKRDGQA